MAKMSEIHEGMSILLKYGDTSVSAEHDEIIVGDPLKHHPDEIDTADIERLEVLRWHWRSEYECWIHFT